MKVMMITEKQRKDFLQMIEGNTPFTSWLAVCLFILPGQLSKLGLSTSEQQKVIDYGKTILAVATKGFFARIGWTTYFALIQDEKTYLIEIFDKAITQLQIENEYCRLWRYGTIEIGEQDPQKTLFDLEWQSYKAATYPNLPYIIYPLGHGLPH